MCRIAADLGPPTPIASLLDGPPHGLTDQSRNTRQMNGGSVAGDGRGVGWFLPEAGPTPGMLESILPLWSDLNARTAPDAILSGSNVGHIRFAGACIETCFTNTPLHVLDDHLRTINGEMQPWPGPLSLALRNRLDPDHESDAHGSTDAEILGALWRTHFRRSGGRGAADAPRHTLGEARDLAREHGGSLKSNIILTSASEVVAVRFADPSGEAASLYRLEGDPAGTAGP